MTRQKRQLPSPSQLRRFLAPKGRLRPDRWKRVQTFADFERLARRRTPLPVFDYVAGAAEGERAMAASVAAFDQVTFHPHVLRDVTQVDSTTTILGRPAAMPLVLGPTGFTRMMHTAGESAVARAAAATDVPYTLSTLGTTGIEALAQAAPDGERWFQLYVWKDRARSEDLIRRAAESGYSTLVLTVDVPVAGARHRDTYNGLTFPPSLSARTLARIAAKPRWLFDALTTEPLAFESLGAADEIMDLINTVFDPSVTLADIAWLRNRWQGSVVIKGVQRVDDAKEIAAIGVDGIALSNHGGRQLDRARAPLDLLPDVVDAIGGSTEIYVDGGVRSGADIAAAVALGAQAVFIGRPYLYALMAGGEPGVAHLLHVLLEGYTRTLKLLGVTSTDQLSRDLVS